MAMRYNANGSAALAASLRLSDTRGGLRMSTKATHLLTAEEFAALPLAGLRSELIEGKLHTMPPTLVVSPQARTIELHRPAIPFVTLSESDTLDGSDVIPGFSAPVADIFG